MAITSESDMQFYDPLIFWITNIGFVGQSCKIYVLELLQIVEGNAQVDYLSLYKYLVHKTEKEKNMLSALFLR